MSVCYCPTRLRRKKIKEND